MNKVILTILLSFFLVLTSQAQLTFTFGTDTISAPGSTVDVDVRVSGFQDIISMQLSLNWDPSVFSFSSLENITDDLPEFSASSIGTPDNAVVVQDGELTISWSGPSTQPASIPNNTRLFTLRLSGVGTLCTGTQVDISNSPRQIEVVDADFNILDVNSSGGNIEIRDASCPGTGGGDGLSFTLADASAAAGSTICIPVTTDNFNEILSFQSGVQWDASVLRFTELRETGLQSITINDEASNQGELRVLWFFDQAAVTLARGASIFELCFEVTGSTGETTPVSLVNLPDFDIEVANEDGAINQFDINNSIFTVGSGGGNQTGVGLIAPDIYTMDATSICIPVSTRNFTGVAALQTGLSFDPDILSFTEIRDVSLSDVDVGISDIDQGDLRIFWQSDFSTLTVTLDDDDVLFEVCFNVLGSDGQRSEIGFVNLPNFAVEFSSELGEPLDFFLEDGSITVGDPPVGSDLSLTVSNATINRGATTCLDVTATGFTNIEGMGFAFQWDPSVITYVDQRNFNLDGLGNSNFSPAGNDRLRVLWTPTAPQTVSDGTSIFQICFQGVDPCGANSSSPVAFISDNTPIEIIGPNNQVLSPQLNNGTVMIGNCGGGSLSINVLSIMNPQCPGSTNGVVNVDFTGASGTVMCLWRRDSDNLSITANCNLIGAPGGSYTLTATDQGGNEATRTVVLEDPSMINVQADVIDASCEGAGQITLSISGGTSANGSYNLMWSNDLPSSTIVTDVVSGTYRVTVTDDNGCQVVEEIEVGDTSFPLNPSIADNNDPENPNGAINLNPGVSGLSFSWSTGSTESSITGLEAGTYSVTIADAAGTCTTERNFIVDNGFVSGDALVESVIGRYNGFGVSCNGESDGILDGEIIGGCDDGPVVVLLNGAEVSLPAESLPPGDHTLRLEDACGNVYEETFTIEEPDAIVNNGLSVVDCPRGASNGVVSLDIAGGTGVYSLSSSIGNQGVGNTIENVSKEPFTVIAQDENGCQAMFSNLEIPDSICPDVSDEPCSARSIISPNGDNVNDAFVIPCVNDANNQPSNLTIYDRWGNLVMEASNYSNDWRGTDMSGEPLPEGGYMWVLTTGGPGNRDLFRGTVSILR